ncbi:MAG: hypothetical protein PHF57_04665 [Methanoregula sp.]|nr:hypothetical protein [Methanoregula sp.]MDD5023696.1 hypothetical protein [Methanoregula sp.]MDD5187482.1 hypothetical protein [Methanoregula sp.]
MYNLACKVSVQSLVSVFSLVNVFISTIEQSARCITSLTSELIPAVQTAGYRVSGFYFWYF